MLEEAMACEGDLAVRGRSENEDTAAVNKERRKAVSSGSKARRPRGPRAPRAPRGPRAPRAPKAPKVSKAGAAGGGGAGSGRKAKPSSPSSGTQPNKPKSPAAALAAGEPEPCGNDDFGGLSDDNDFIDDSGLEAGGGDGNKLVSRADAGGAKATPRREGEHQNRHQDSRAKTPSCRSDSSGFLSQSPLSPDMLPDTSLPTVDREGPGEKDSGAGSSTENTVNGAGGTSRGTATATNPEAEASSASGPSVPDATLPHLPEEAAPAPAVAAAAAMAAASGASAAGGCEPDALAALLMEMGVLDDDIVQPSGRNRLDALLREAGGEKTRALRLYFERQSEKGKQEEKEKVSSVPGPFLRVHQALQHMLGSTRRFTSRL